MGARDRGNAALVAPLASGPVLEAAGVGQIIRAVPWLSRGPAAFASVREAAPDWAAPWLMPFLAILAAAMTARAASEGFEWLYPLRLAAAAAALWHYRDEYRRLDWRPDWSAPAAGAAVFVRWIALDRFTPSRPDPAFAAALAGAGAAARIGWIAVRAAAAGITVPIAEELAFRGFLLRQVVSARFLSVDPRRFHAGAWLVSSVAFGLLHGNRWLAGTLAGAAYAWAYGRRGSLGNAAAAHGITNALLAAWVLTTGETQLW